MSENGNFQENDELEKKEIEQIMREKHNYFESKLSRQHKEEVLGKLGLIIKTWSFEVSIKSTLPELEANKIEAKLFTFGSYRLNVISNESDIDTICVVPKFFTREEHFFIDLVEKLRENPKVEELVPVINSKVPIIKMVFDGIPVDMSFAQLDMQTIEDNLDLSDNKLLINMDDKSCKSLNGRRVADLILKSVPDAEIFRQTLRAIKLWAKNKGIYSNVMGYLGGVSWAILVSKICQIHQKVSLNQLIYHFFQYYSNYDWTVPVKIVEIKDEPNNPKNSEQWTGTPYEMQSNKMFIITPAFPCMNSSHMVTDTSLNIMKKMFKESFNLVSNIREKKNSWDDFFIKFDFFQEYEHFIEIDILGKKNEDEFRIWQGFVESKIRKIGIFFERPNYYEQYYLGEYFDFHLFPNGFNKKDFQFDFCRSFFYGIKLKQEIENDLEFDFMGPVTNFLRSLNDDKVFQRNPKFHNLRIYYLKKNELSIEVMKNNNGSSHSNIINNNNNGNNNGGKRINNNGNINNKTINENKINGKTQNSKNVVNKNSNNGNEDYDKIIKKVKRDANEKENTERKDQEENLKIKNNINNFNKNLSCEDKFIKVTDNESSNYLDELLD